jgi:ectoine hydroxylase-related dioxygenase (phytanoyl-CoA dioxygenase family)
MRYIPGSHASGSIYAHRVTVREGIVLNQEVDPASFDASRARDDVLRAGQFSLHDVFLIHGSGPNRSARRRAGFVIRYMPGTSLFERISGWKQSQSGVSFNLSRRPIWLVRGQDRAGNDFRLGHGEDYYLVPRESDDQ